MRLFSPLNVLLIIVIWSAFFLLAARYFLYNAHQSWFMEEEQRLLGSLEFKIDNLDARNMRQLNQLYGEVQKVEDMLRDLMRRNGSSHGGALATPGPPIGRGRDHNTLDPSIAVLVIACNRVDYIKRTLDELLKFRPSAGLFPIIVSQDCGHQQTSRAISNYGGRITHIKHPDLSDIVIPASDRKIKNKRAEMGYYKISRHYKWALTQVFDERDFQYVIVVEDDLIIAPDFYIYFSSLYPLLNADPSIMCVSAFNDNGKAGYIDLQQNDLLYRTDFFPGLGWMLTKKLWEELKPKWPLKFWDDWLREPEQRKGRACIRPEVSRTITIGKQGVSMGEYYKQHLQYIVLNKETTNFAQKNLTYLEKGSYQEVFVSRVHKLPQVSLQEVLSGTQVHKEAQLRYSTNKDFQAMAKKLRIMSDFRGGVARTAYQGIVSIMYNKKRVHLVSQ